MTALRKPFGSCRVSGIEMAGRSDHCRILDNIASVSTDVQIEKSLTCREKFHGAGWLLPVRARTPVARVAAGDVGGLESSSVCRHRNHRGE